VKKLIVQIGLRIKSLHADFKGPELLVDKRQEPAEILTGNPARTEQRKEISVEGRFTNGSRSDEVCTSRRPCTNNQRSFAPVIKIEGRQVHSYFASLFDDGPSLGKKQ